MHSFLLNLTLGILGKAEELVLASPGAAERVLTTDVKILGTEFEVEVIVRKKGV